MIFQKLMAWKTCGDMPSVPISETIDNLNTASRCASLLVSDLRQANRGNRNVQLSDTLLDLIGQAYAMEHKLKRLEYAVSEDERRAGRLVES